MTTRWARLARGWLAAIGATFAAAFSHVVAGGGHPPFFAVALSLAFAGLACTVLAGRRFSRTRLALSVFASQFLYHGLFSVFGQSSTASPAVSQSAPGHFHGVVLHPSSAPGLAGGLQWEPAMLAAHAVAAIATLTLMLYGEHLARAVVARAELAWDAAAAGIMRVVALLRGALPALPSPASLRTTAEWTLLRPVPAVLPGSLLRRGPPVVAAR